MKKFFYSAFLLVASAAFVTSCQKEIQPVVQQSLESKLASDESFAKMMNSTVELSNSLTEAITSEDAAKIADIIGKKDKASKEELAFVAEKLGGTSDRFIQQLTIFSGALNDLEQKYEFSKMDQTELTAVIDRALELNPELKAKLTVASANGKAGSVGAGICRLAVSLASLFGGGALCTAINVSTIPVIGGVLCSALLGVATNILNAACDLIP